jgi:peptidoglycan hydrolase-like protein with peptidoglycan-binding domain
MEILELGAQGEDVRSLQALLRILDLYDGELDSSYGQTTADAVKRFQRQNQLQETSAFDAATQLMFEGKLSLVRGALRCLDYYRAEDGGQEHVKLANAVKELQQAQHIEGTARLDAATRRALSDAIVKIQSKLYFLGDFKGFVDGNYTTFLNHGIAAFQRKNGFAATGICDADTKLALCRQAVIAPDSNAPAATEAVSAQQQRAALIRREKVAAIQRKLAACHGYFGPQDGCYSDATKTALQEFQRQYNLPRRDGHCDDYTWWKLNEEAGTLFCEAFQWELDALDDQRNDLIPDQADPRPAAESEVVEQAHRRQFLGLAFSGGGIRSATFNLGMLQALAEVRLLREFHYLSTVSGGGYIGSWLSAWIHREQGRVESVEEKLAVATRKQGEKEEPDQIKFLRQYSNYLTPSVGIFGADTWAVIATYLRNVLLNLAILVAVLSAVMLLPRAALWLVLHYAQASTHRGDFAFWFGTLAVIALLTAVFFIALNISLKPLPNKRRIWLLCNKQGCVITSVVVPLMLSGFFGSAWVWFERDAVFAHWREPRYVVGIALIYLAVWGSGWILAQRANGLGASGDGVFHRQVLPHLIFTLLALVLGVWLSVQVLAFVAGEVGGNAWLNHVTNLTTLGMPIALSVFGLTMVLLVGLLGRAYSDRSREWWSRMGGWTIIFTFAWLALFTVNLYGPPLMAWLNLWASSTLTLGWVATTIAGVVMGKSSLTGTAGSKRSVELFVKVAPYVFVLGILLLIAVILQKKLAPFDMSVDTDLYGHMNGAFIASENASMARLLGALVGCVAVALVLAWRVDVNKFSLYMMYRNRLVRCYLGASNAQRQPHPFTGFDPADDPHLVELLWRSADKKLQRPFHIFNTALNLVKGKELAWQERKAGSFSFTPAFCGFELPKRPGQTQPSTANGVSRGCYRTTKAYAAGKPSTPSPTEQEREDGGVRKKIVSLKDEEEGVKVGMALAISGAAASPNMGHHSSPPLAFLMTMFNVRLGRWCANPRSETTWRKPSPGMGLFCLISELFGFTNADSNYVYLSDGGHFENLGIYELVRRRCRLICAIDATADGDTSFADLGDAIRKCYTDFGIEIDLDVHALARETGSTTSSANCAIGTIHYEKVDAEGAPGTLLYIKPSLLSSEGADILSYAKRDPRFPHQSTADQWFDESQFESYRKLGYNIGGNVFHTASEAARAGAEGTTALDLQKFIDKLRETFSKSTPSRAENKIS